MRLIDADALKVSVPDTSADIFENCRNCKTLMDWEVKELIDQQPTASPWRRVEEPPEENGAYVVWWNYKGSSYWFRGVFYDGRWLFEPGTPKPDYWMPIEPPKEDA